MENTEEQKEFKDPLFTFDCPNCHRMLGWMKGKIVHADSDVFIRNKMIIFQCPVDGGEREICANSWDFKLEAGDKTFFAN